MAYYKTTDICTPLGDFPSQGGPCNALWGAVSCSKSATGLSKGGGVCDVLGAKNPSSVFTVHNLVGHQSYKCHYQTRTGSGRKATLGIKV